MASLADLSDEELAELTPDQIARSGENKEPLAIAICAAVLAVTLTFCLLRVYVRIRIVGRFGKDDWAVVVALAGVVAFVVLLMSKCRYGMGRHIWLLSEQDQEMGMKITTVYLMVYQIAFSTVKAGFLLQYRRAFPLPNFQRVCKGILIFVILFTATQIVAIGVGCIPYDKLWKSDLDGKCIDKVAFWYFNSVVHLVTDIAIIVLPMPLLHTLPLRRVQKLVLMGIFGLGFFVAAVSIVRITYLIPAAVTPDHSYDTINSSLWSVGEISCALVCLCIPTLRPLIHRAPGSANRSNVEGSEYTAPDRMWEVESGRSKSLRLPKFELMGIEVDDGRSANRLPGSSGNGSEAVGWSPVTATTAPSSGSRNDGFWFGEGSEVEERVEQGVRTALSPPPRVAAAPGEKLKDEHYMVAR